jgi:hypothetical protein
MHELQSQLDRALLQNKHMEMEIKGQNQLLAYFHREAKPSGFVVEPSNKLPPIPQMEESSLVSVEREWKTNSTPPSSFGSAKCAFVPDTPKLMCPTSRHL